MEEEIRQKLYDKLEKEYKSFIKNLKNLTSEEIIDKSYEKVMKEETLAMFYPESKMFDIDEIKVLSKESKPLEYLYQDWLDSDLNLNQLYEDNVKESLYDLKEKYKSKSAKDRKER